MDQRIQSHLVLVFVVLLGLPALAGLPDQERESGDRAHGSEIVGSDPVDAAQSTCMLSVLVFDYAEVGPEDLDEAKQRVAAIFRKAGIDMEWRLFFQATGVPSPPAQSGSGRCALSLNIVLPAKRGYSSMRKHLRLPKTALAFALTQVDGGTHGDTVYVFVNQVEEVIRRERFARLGPILGAIIAHELGHLLLGRGHSPDGLMSAEVAGLTVRLAGANALYFDVQQAQRLRAAMEERSSSRR